MKFIPRLLALFTFVAAVPTVADEPKLSRFQYTEPHMGTTFRLVLYAESRMVKPPMPLRKPRSRESNR